jgi:hypothetical protein
MSCCDSRLFELVDCGWRRISSVVESPPRAVKHKNKIGLKKLMSTIVDNLTFYLKVPPE